MGNVYPGLIKRQELVNLCQAKLPLLEKENLEMMESLEILERSRQDHIHTIHAIYEGLQKNYGFQSALREVCEWAKENVVEEPAVEDPEEQDMVTKYNQLKAKYNRNDLV